MAIQIKIERWQSQTGQSIIITDDNPITGDVHHQRLRDNELDALIMGLMQYRLKEMPPHGQPVTFDLEPTASPSPKTKDLESSKMTADDWPTRTTTYRAVLIRQDEYRKMDGISINDMPSLVDADVRCPRCGETDWLFHIKPHSEEIACANCAGISRD